MAPRSFDVFQADVLRAGPNVPEEALQGKAVTWNVIVVSFLRRRAVATLAGSPLARLARSLSPQPVVPTPSRRCALPLLPPSPPIAPPRRDVPHRPRHQFKQLPSKLRPLYGLSAKLAQGIQETLSIAVVPEDHLSAIPSIHDAVDRARIIDPQLACHPRQRPGDAHDCQLAGLTRMALSLGLTPSS